jgi:lysozyme
VTEESLKLFVHQLIRDEALRLTPYADSVGVLTIGVGHNLYAKPITERAAMVILEDDIADALTDLDRALPWWRDMDEVRQMVLANMCFNVGITKLLEFKNTLEAMKRGDYRMAALGVTNSKWFTQVGERAKRLVRMMQTGELE